MGSHSKSNAYSLEQAIKSTVLSANGGVFSFGTLLDQQELKVKRTLVVFIRHFFCGNCQEYIRRLATDLAPSTLPEDLSIIIIGCGAPSLISSYLEVTECPFPLYADPSTQLYKMLGMQRSLSLGSKGPAYIRHSLATGVMKSVMQGLKRIPSGDVGKAGDLSVNGGEFLFTRCESSSNWTITWSHRMMNSRDHTEIETLKVQLKLAGGLDMLASQAQNSRNTKILDSASSCSSISEHNVCGQPQDLIRKSNSIKRRSWMIRAGQLTRSSSIRRSMIHVS